MSLAVIDTGCANIASVGFALDRLGAAHAVARTPAEAVGALRLILPGVGAAPAAMSQLKARGWDEALKADTRPLLGVCLGMQLLFERSEEGEAEGLGLIEGEIERLPRKDGLTWPHMGWNALEGLAHGEPLLRGVAEGDRVYCVHGFNAPKGPASRAHVEYGVEASALVRQGHVAGCQFHPERSGAVGARILKNFLETPV